MNQSLNRRKQPRFEIINKYNVTIRSLRNQLKHASGIDELTTIATSIVELEHKIMLEKSAGYRQLEKQKKRIKDKVEELSRLLNQAEQELENIDKKLTVKLDGYKDTLQDKINLLNLEYMELSASFTS